jgi:cytidylate kinase
MTNNCQALRPFYTVAIDGGAASGKSSTSIRLAERMNFMHVDTGTHYRAVTHACIVKGLDPGDIESLVPFVAQLRFSSLVQDHECLICLQPNQPLAGEQLRSPEVNAQVSQLSAVPAVREAVKSYQREQVEVARREGFAGVVMDGRDIGTVILPDADLKVFLQADPETRQKRRELEGATDEIRDRDRRDSSRATAPLKPASDAIVVDNSEIGLEEVVDVIIGLLPNEGARE